MEIITGIISSISTTTLFLLVAYLGRNYFIERLRLSLQKEHTKFLDELQWSRKVQEQAARVSEYLALARRLKKDSLVSDYEKANQLSWELAMWLPEETYKEMTQAVVNPSKDINELSVVVSVRKILLGDTLVFRSPGSRASSTQT